jgi:hypothetical protein
MGVSVSVDTKYAAICVEKKFASELFSIGNKILGDRNQLDITKNA